LKNDLKIPEELLVVVDKVGKKKGKKRHKKK